LQAKEVVVVEHALRLLGRAEFRAEWIEDQFVLVCHRSGAELQGRNMALTGGSEAEDHPRVTRSKVLLVTRQHNRRVEQCRRLDRILHREVAADQQLLVVAEHIPAADLLEDLLEILPEHVFDISVPFGEIPHHVVEQPRGVGVGKPGHAIDDPLEPIQPPGQEGTCNHARLVGEESEVLPFDCHRCPLHASTLKAVTDRHCDFSIIEMTIPPSERHINGKTTRSLSWQP